MIRRLKTSLNKWANQLLTAQEQKGLKNIKKEETMAATNFMPVVVFKMRHSPSKIAMKSSCSRLILKSNTTTSMLKTPRTSTKSKCMPAAKTWASKSSRGSCSWRLHSLQKKAKMVPTATSRRRCMTSSIR